MYHLIDQSRQNQHAINVVYPSIVDDGIINSGHKQALEERRAFVSWCSSIIFHSR